MSKNLKSSLKTWVSKVFRTQTKPKRSMGDVVRKITTSNQKESRDQLEDIIAQDLFTKLDQLKGREADASEALTMVEAFLKEHELIQTLKMQTFINQIIQKYFSSSVEIVRTSPDEIVNVCHSDNFIYDCICPKISRDLQVSQRIETCYRCKRECHTNCLWPAESREEEYECPYCFLRFCIPQRRVESVLFGGYLRQTKKDKIVYKINLPLELSEYQDCVLEARCVRLSKQGRYEITWPENCFVWFNQKKANDYRPLPAASSLKRRMDEELVFQKRNMAANSNVTIEEKHQYIEGARGNSNQNHFIIIARVRVLGCKEVQQNLMSQVLSVEKSKQKLRDYLDRGFQDCYIERMKVSLKCHFYGMRVELPARSLHCRSHYQPFDLKNFIYANVSSKNSSQRWRCPICKKRAYDVQVDEYLLNIIASDPALTEIYFNRQGELQSLEAQKQNENQQVVSNPIASIGSMVGQDEPLQEQHEDALAIKKECKETSIIHVGVRTNQISIQEVESRSKIQFHEYIELQDSDEEQRKSKVLSTKKDGSRKRSYKSRSQVMSLEEGTFDIIKKKNKRETGKSQSQPVEPSFVPEQSSVLPLQVIESNNMNEEYDGESGFSDGDEDYLTNRNERKKPSRRSRYTRERVGIDMKPKEVPMMSKNLVPSPNIRTVIPQAIRIADVRLPQPKKPTLQQQTIQINDNQEESPELLYHRKVDYHKSLLMSEKDLLLSQCGSSEICAWEQNIFMSMCEKLLFALGKM